MDKTDQKAHEKDFHFDAVNEDELAATEWNSWSKSQQPSMQPKNIQIRKMNPSPLLWLLC